MKGKFVLQLSKIFSIFLNFYVKPQNKDCVYEMIKIVKTRSSCIIRFCAINSMRRIKKRRNKDDDSAKDSPVHEVFHAAAQSL